MNVHVVPIRALQPARMPAAVRSRPGARLTDFEQASLELFRRWQAPWRQRAVPMLKIA